MQKEFINKTERQTVFDVLLMYSGAISGLFEFLNQNALDSIELPEGQYIAPEVLNEDIVHYFLKDNLEIATEGDFANQNISLLIDNENNFIIDNELNYILVN